jgi:hypothetical protein
MIDMPGQWIGTPYLKKKLTAMIKPETAYYDTAHDAHNNAIKDVIKFITKFERDHYKKEQKLIKRVK